MDIEPTRLLSFKSRAHDFVPNIKIFKKNKEEEEKKFEEMALKLSPLTFKIHRPTHAYSIVESARISRGFFPLISQSSSNAVVQTQNTRWHSWRCKVKSGEAEGNPSMESLILDEQSLQHDLEMAVKEEDYARAAKLRDNLRLLNEDSKASVLAANSRFYHAFRNGDLAAMQSIWAQGENVYVVHPGAGRISGYDLVMESWEIVCGAEHEFPIRIDLKNVEVHVKGDVGYVTCMEVVKTKGSSWGKQVATNVFERVDGKWYMCIHHASHIDM